MGSCPASPLLPLLPHSYCRFPCSSLGQSSSKGQYMLSPGPLFPKSTRSSAGPHLIWLLPAPATAGRSPLPPGFWVSPVSVLLPPHWLPLLLPRCHNAGGAAGLRPWASSPPHSSHPAHLCLKTRTVSLALNTTNMPAIP